MKGSPKEHAVDPDAVFGSSETYGEAIGTRGLEDFRTEQGNFKDDGGSSDSVREQEGWDAIFFTCCEGEA